MICLSLTGARMLFTEITGTGHSRMSRKKQGCLGLTNVGIRAVLSLTTIATAMLIYSWPVTWNLISRKHPRLAVRRPATGKGYPSTAAHAVYRLVAGSYTGTRKTAGLPT